MSEDASPPEKTVDTPVPEAGTLIGGRFRLGEILGRGGMGTVFEAQHELTGGRVALKVLNPDRVVAPRNRQRFELEARNAAVLQHANTVRIYDYGLDSAWDPPLPYLAMELVDGEPLSTLINKLGRVPWRRAVHIAGQVLKSLWEAHEHPRHIVHRDIKPSNVLVLDLHGEPDFVKVVDFGVARALAGGGDDLVDCAGSPTTMAPEQWFGGAIGPPTDLYALGCTLYQMLAGRPPFSADTLDKMARAHCSKSPRPLLELAAGDTPKALADWVSRLMRKQSRLRPASAREALRSLELVAAESSRPVVEVGSAGAEGGTPLEGAGPPPTERHTFPERPAFDTTAPSAIASMPVRGLGPSRTNLQPSYTVFVGRQREREALGRAFADGARLVTVHGPGGTGKTRLCREWGRSQIDAWSGGVWFCDLTEATALERLVVAVSAALGVSLTEGEPLAQLGEVLRVRGPTLLILDNLEQVVGPAREAVTAWRDRAPEVCFVATSRERLGLPGEVVLPLEPLGLPAPDAELAAADLLETEAVALFVERARATHPAFELGDSIAGDVAELVRQLDGMPLAIELAAARVRVLPPKKLLANLGRRFELLKRRDAGVSGRQAALVATIDWSWQLLDGPERHALAQCSVFRGGFDLEASEAVLDLSAWPDGPDALEVVELLCDKSLLRPGAQGGDEPRFSMYASIQAFAAAKLAESGAIAGPGGEVLSGPEASNEVAGRHAGHFARLGEPEALARLNSEPEALPALQLELENLWAAWAWGLANREGRLAAAGALFAIRELARRRGPHRLALETGPPLAACADLPVAIRAQIELDVADIAGVSGDLDLAERHLAAAEALVAEDPTSELEAMRLNERGLFEYLRGRLEESVRFAEQALAVATRAGNAQVEMLAETTLGAAARLQGDLARAQDLFEAGLATAGRSGDRAMEARFHANLGAVFLDGDQTEEARRHLQAAVKLARRMGDRRTERWARMNGSVLDRLLGDLSAARQALERCQRMAEHDGDWRLLVFCRVNRATLELDQGRHVAQRQVLEETLKEARERGQPRLESMLLQLLARLHLELGELDQAGRVGAEFLDSSRSLGDPLQEVAALLLLGRLAEREGRLGDAAAHLSEALALAERAAPGRSEGEVAGHLAVVHLLAGRLDEARDLVERAVACLRDLGAPFELGVALCQRAMVARASGEEARAEASRAAAEELARRLEVRPPGALAVWLSRCTPT